MKHAKRGGILRRLDTLEDLLAPKETRPSWQVVMEQMERHRLDAEAKLQAFIAEHYPDGLPIIDEATLSEEERAVRATAMREIRADLERISAQYASH